MRIDRFVNSGAVRVKFRDCDLRGVIVKGGKDGFGVMVPRKPGGTGISIDYPRYGEYFAAITHKSLDVDLEYRLTV